MNRYGYEEVVWDSTKRAAKTLLSEYAQRRQMIPYADFVRQIGPIQFEPHDSRLFHLLGEISSEESSAGRGMLSALVVHKHGDMQPGPGFFNLAKKLGHSFSDVVTFWIEEVKKVFAAWKS